MRARGDSRLPPTSFFEKGEIGPTLADELVRRYQQKRAAGHNVPDVGEVAVA